MDPGRLDRRISIEQPVNDQLATGEPVITWVKIADVWAELMPQSGGEAFTTGQRTSQQQVQFRIRKRDGIEPTMRVVWRSKYYEILDVGEPDRDRFLILTCTTPENAAKARS